MSKAKYFDHLTDDEIVEAVKERGFSLFTDAMRHFWLLIRFWRMPAVAGYSIYESRYLFEWAFRCLQIIFSSKKNHSYATKQAIKVARSQFYGCALVSLFVLTIFSFMTYNIGIGKSFIFLLMSVFVSAFIKFCVDKIL